MPESLEHGSRPTVSIDGTPLTDELQPALIRTIVDCQLAVPDMFLLQFRDSENNLVSRAKIHFGSQISIAVTADGDGAPTTILSGEVTALEQESDAGGTWTLVRGYDLMHRLSRGCQTRTFTDTTDCDMVRQIAAAAGVSLGELEDNGVSYEHVSQVNVSDWDFLRARAGHSGYDLSIRDGHLHWTAPTHSAGAPAPDSDLFDPPAPLQLLLGRDLLRFRARVTAAEQVSEVQVRGWDPQQKTAILASAAPAQQSASVGVSPSELAGGFAAPPYVVVDRPIRTQGEADAMASAVASRLAGGHADADGAAHGNPALRPGVAVAIGKVGWPHDGRYVLSSARHIYDETGYRTEFTVSGGQDRSLLGLSAGSGSGGRRAGGPVIPGLVIGQVTSVANSEGQLRVKVTFPWLAADYESWWCRVVQLGAGAGRGLLWLPEVGDEVLVGFEHGDSASPYVLGGLYNGVDTPPLAEDVVDAASGQVKLRALVSRTNHRLVLKDDDAATQVLLSTGDDSLSITLDQSQSTIVIDARGSITIHGAQNVGIKSDADLSIEAGGSLSLSGQAGVKIDGGPSVQVSGGVIKLN